MDYEGKQDYEESSAAPKCVTVQEFEVNASLSTLGSDNQERGTEALPLVVRDVLEGVLKSRIRETSETLQARCMDCGKKRDRSSLRLEPHSAKRVRTHLSGSNGSARGGLSVSVVSIARSVIQEIVGRS
ncbi:hypothetical protein J1N35_043462 [Gossypium stocksii]|uniref:Uncharacterized protein n=1 Tax=Gossypium stocksii TaxID=47602 RepID=A0A9D3U7G8_9ROSI|nr:hypothetical protein J1N35_043462 [Gossypium stocksii]